MDQQDVGDTRFVAGEPALRCRGAITQPRSRPRSATPGVRMFECPECGERFRLDAAGPGENPGDG